MKNWPMALLAVFAGVSVANAQTCSGNNDFQGPYVMLASRSVASPAPESAITPGLTPPAAVQYSNTPIGRMLKSAAGNGVFAITLRFLANGQGELLAAAPDASLINTRVGTYTVNGDCTIALTVADGFGAELDFQGNTVTRGNIAFQGVLKDRGNEADFAQTGPGIGSTFRVQRPHTASACTNALLNGVFGVYATGIDLGPPDAASGIPFTMVGRFAAENGEFFLDGLAQASPQPKRQITGTYKVEVDCTGTAKFIQDGKTLNVNFVLTKGGVTFGLYARPTMTFAFTDGRVIGSGEAR